MLLVASETGHVYTYATKKLQPMIGSEVGKNLIQNCLNAPGGEKLLSIGGDPPNGRRLSQSAAGRQFVSHRTFSELGRQSMQIKWRLYLYEGRSGSSYSSPMNGPKNQLSSFDTLLCLT